MAESLYVYALLDTRVASPRPERPNTRTSGRPDVRTIGGSDVRFRRIEVIDVGGVFAAIERLHEPPALSEQTLREQHQIVVRLARTAKAILPVRFGTFVDREELERVVEARHDMLEQAFRAVRGKAQMTVRVFGPSRRAASPQTPTSGAEYLRARAALSKPHLPKIARAILDAVRPFVSAETIDAGRGSVRVTINHLVDRSAVPEYVTTVENIVGRPEARGQRSGAGTLMRGSGNAGSVAVVSGPWPPFAFVPDLLSAALPLERLTP